MSVGMIYLSPCLISEFDANGFSLDLLVELPLAGSEEMPY